VQVQPGFLRFLEMCGEYAGRRDDKGRDRQPMREKENAAPVDAERRAAGDQKGQGIDPPPPLMDRGAFRPQQNQHADGKGGRARNEMHPSEREQVEFHGRASAVQSAV
jgi:hypothetical protein